MSGKEGIIQEILDNAKIQGDNIINNATVEQNNALNQEQDELMQKKDNILAKAQKEAGEIQSRKLTIANLESRKVLLQAKQNLITQAYDLAMDRLVNLSDDKYIEFMTSLIVKYASDGDCVIVSKKDAVRLDEKWLNNAAKKAGKKLSLSDSCHNFQGGLILTSNKYDKNLTLSALIKEIKPVINGQIVDKLFS